MTTTPLPPLDWVAMLKEAIGIVKGKPHYKRLIDGTPLSNDVPVWMADFAVTQAEQARADLEAENKRLREALQIAVTQNEHDMLMTGEELRQARAALENRA